MAAQLLHLLGQHRPIVLSLPKPLTESVHLQRHHRQRHGVDDHHKERQHPHPRPSRLATLLIAVPVEPINDVAAPAHHGLLIASQICTTVLTITSTAGTSAA